MSQRYNDDIKRLKPQDTQLGILKIQAFCWEIQQRASDPRREYFWCYIVSVFENVPKNLVVQGRVQLEHSHIVNVGVEATCLHFNHWCILKGMTELAGPFGTMPQEP